MEAESPKHRHSDDLTRLALGDGFGAAAGHLQ